MKFAFGIIVLCIIYYIFFGPAPEKEVTNFPIQQVEHVEKLNEVPQGTNWISWAFCLVAGWFVVTVFNRVTKSATNIGMKKTRRGAFQLVVDLIANSSSGEKVTSAGTFQDEGGQYDEIETKDAFDVEKSYYISSVDDLNKLNPDDIK